MKSKYQKLITISHWTLVSFLLVLMTGCDSNADHQVRPIVDIHNVPEA